MNRSSLLVLVVALLVACAPLPPADAPGAPQASVPGGLPPPAFVKADPQVTNVLVDLVENKDRSQVNLAGSEGTPLGDLLKVGSPVGYNLRNRHLKIGIPLAEALSRNADPVFRQKLIDLARWDRDNETRSAALVVLARLHDPAHFNIFREAAVHLDAGVRFGALEALVIWGHKQKALPFLSAAADRDYEPILRVYAAQGLARLDEPSGLLRLRAFLDDQSWLGRAMAARALGDLGTAEDYTLLVSRIGRETQNDFVVAEYCIAALKLFPKKQAAFR